MSFSFLTKKLKSATKDEFNNVLNTYADQYFHPKQDSDLNLPNEYDGKSPSELTDDEYDVLDALFELRFGKRNKIGSTPSSASSSNLPTSIILKKVELPRYLGGLDKYWDNKELSRYLDRTEKMSDEEVSYIYFDKLDGISADLVIKNGIQKMYKRGDETHGTDISELLPFFKIPTHPVDCNIRGELIMCRDVFNAKYAETMKNPRNMVAGLTNAKTLNHEALRDIIFIAYQVAKPNKLLSKSKQLQLLLQWQFNVCHHMPIDKEEG